MPKTNEYQDPPSTTDCTDLLMDAIQSIMKNETIEKAILTITQEVELYHSLTQTADGDEKDFDSNYDIEKSIEFCLENISKGKVTNSLLNDLHFSTISPKNQKEKERSLIVLSEIYIAISQAALEENKLMWAWGAACRARGYINSLLGMHDPTINAQYKRAKAGGLKKSANANRAKEMVIDVIRQKRPPRGWKSPRAAADEVIDTVIDLIATESLSLPSDRNELLFYLVNLINENKNAKKAFEEQSSH